MKIVVATDGSRGGNAAVRFGARLAARDARSRLVVITIEGASDTGPKPAGGMSPAEIAFSKAAKEVRSAGIERRCQFRAVRAGGEIPEAISALADRVRADLLVIGSEGRDTLSEWVVGGVALRLIYVATRPVAVVRPPRRRTVAVADRPVSLTPGVGG